MRSIDSGKVRSPLLCPHGLPDLLALLLVRFPVRLLAVAIAVRYFLAATAEHTPKLNLKMRGERVSTRGGSYYSLALVKPKQFETGTAKIATAERLKLSSLLITVRN